MVKACDSITQDMCGNKITQQSVSPDGQLKAIAFSRNCGATTGFSTQISILPVDAHLSNEPGNTFITDSAPELVKPAMQWSSDPSTLQISFTRQGQVFKENQHYGDEIVIHYREIGG